MTKSIKFQPTRPVWGGTLIATAAEIDDWRDFNPPAPCGAGQVQYSAVTQGLQEFFWKLRLPFTGHAVRQILRIHGDDVIRIRSRRGDALFLLHAHPVKEFPRRKAT